MNGFRSSDRRLRYSCIPTWFRSSKRHRLRRWTSTGSWVRAERNVVRIRRFDPIIFSILSALARTTVLDGSQKRFSFQTPAASQDKTDDVNMSCDRINLKTCVTDVAHDYTKRKHVMRLCSSVADVGCTELLLQTDDASSMVRWLKALQEQALEAPPSSLSADEVSPRAPCVCIYRSTARFIILASVYIAVDKTKLSYRTRVAGS